MWITIIGNHGAGGGGGGVGWGGGWGEGGGGISECRHSNWSSCPKDCYCDITMMWWLLLFHRIRADLSMTHDNASTTRMHDDYRLSIDRFFVGFNAICHTFLQNSPTYIQECNYRLITFPLLFYKWSGLSPSDTLSSWWLGWGCHALMGKPFYGKPLDLSFQIFTIGVLTIYICTG